MKNSCGGGEQNHGARLPGSTSAGGGRRGSGASGGTGSDEKIVLVKIEAVGSTDDRDAVVGAISERSCVGRRKEPILRDWRVIHLRSMMNVSVTRALKIVLF